MLPANDLEYLRSLSPGHTVQLDGGMTCVLVPGFLLGEGFALAQSDLLLRLAPGYPDVPPDMWWFNPPVRRTDSAEIIATQAREQLLGREWQRWSRHLTPGQWRSGIDSLESYIAIIRRELRASAPKVAV